MNERGSVILDGEEVTTEDLLEVDDPVMIEITPEGVVIERFQNDD